MRRSALPAAMLPLLMLGTPVSAAEAPPADTQEIERLYTEGDGRFADRDYIGAADSWERLLQILPENEGNKAIRGALVIMIAEALINAHHHLVADDGSKDKAHLERALAILDGYLVALREAYGPDAQLTLASRRNARRSKMRSHLPSTTTTSALACSHASTSSRSHCRAVAAAVATTRRSRS